MGACLPELKLASDSTAMPTKPDFRLYAGPSRMQMKHSLKKAQFKKIFPAPGKSRCRKKQAPGCYNAQQAFLFARQPARMLSGACHFVKLRFKRRNLRFQRVHFGCGRGIAAASLRGQRRKLAFKGLDLILYALNTVA